jgi:hypothetical protein
LQVQNKSKRQQQKACYPPLPHKGDADHGDNDNGGSPHFPTLPQRRSFWVAFFAWALMTCSELGFSDDYGLRVSKSADLEVTFPFASSYDFDGYSGTFKIRASEDSATALLTVTPTATANGSVLVYSGSNILIRLKKADLATLPEDATDSDDPWVGVFEWVNTDTASLTTRFHSGPIIVERGVAW